MFFYLLIAAAIIDAADKSPAVKTTQSPLKLLKPANPAPTFIIQTFTKKNNMPITINNNALKTVNPKANIPTVAPFI